ncbi:hypothetical protein [Streptomyces sp. NPDC000410]|uniref:hypothetical protein n=1 Tax=Streptomyces sp. NPDC000410 TaxID=3154254 RepID=UPI0033288DC5
MADVADVARASGALYDVTNVLCKRLFAAEIDTGQPGVAAELAWEALLVIADAWRDTPHVPDELRKLVFDAALRRA